MRWRLLLLLGGLFLVSDLMAQTAVSNQPLDVREGLWQATLTSHMISPLSPTLLEHLTPEQRARTLALSKAQQDKDKGTVQKRTICIDPKSLRAGNFLGSDAGCSKELTSSSQKLEVRLKCGPTERTSLFERINSENLKGSIQNTIPNSDTTITVNETLVANWVGAHCPTHAEEMQARGIAIGANPDVLSFLPYLPPGGEGRLGRFFSYFWNAGPSPQVPMIGYEGQFPGGPRRGSTIYFDGTDGKYLYVTFVEALSLSCGQLYKIDKSGNPTRLPEIPLGLKGGSDEFSGGPPCRPTLPR